MIKLKCKKCKRSFEVWNYRKNTAKYCSKECHPYQQKKIEKEFRCDYCNKIFIQNPHYRKNKRCFCSYNCKSKYQIGKHLGKPKNGIYKICPICKNQFYASKSKIWVKTCSKKCGNKLKIGKYKPWNYIHGLGKERRKYGIYWESHRGKILERDNHICQCCYKKGNHVDHIIPFRISQDNSFSNLQTLCVSCHGKKTNWEIKWY